MGYLFVVVVDNLRISNKEFIVFAKKKKFFFSPSELPLFGFGKWLRSHLKLSLATKIKGVQISKHLIWIREQRFASTKEVS